MLVCRPVWRLRLAGLGEGSLVVDAGLDHGLDRRVYV